MITATLLSIRPPVLVSAFIALAALGSVAQEKPVKTRPHRVQEWLDRTEGFYAGRDAAQLRRSSGWKHFVKIRRFLKARTVGGVPPTAGVQMQAYLAGLSRSKVPKLGADWTPVGPSNVSGRIVDLKFHPTNSQLVYAASASGGVWISSDGGDTWRTTTDSLPSLAIGAVCVLPTDPNVILAATGEGLHWTYVVYGMGIFKSTDAGETWAPTSLTHEITDNHGFHVMEANPFTGTVLAGANDGLWRSTDEGDTWTRVLAGAEYYDVQWKPGSASRVYATKGNAASGNGVKVSNDDGLTWAPAGIGQPASSLISKTKLAVTPSDPSVLYAHFGNRLTGGTLGIYRSTDDGATWSARNTTLNISGSQGTYAVTIGVDPDDPQRVIAGGIEVYLSTDGGLTFAETGDGDPLGDDTAIHWDHHAIVWEPGSSSNVWVGTDGGPWRSTDNGDTWSPKRDGLLTTQFYDVGIDANDSDFAMGGSQDNGLPWVEAPGTPWFPSTLTADGLASYVETQDSSTIHAESQFGGHVRSRDRGQSWVETTNGLTGVSRAFAPLDLDPNRAGHLYTGTSDGIFRTDDGQDLWVRVALQQATWISISRVDGDIVWTTDGLEQVNPPVRFTTNDGGSWTFPAPYGFAVGNETKILAHPTDSATAFVTFAGYSGVAHVARTQDFGATWEDVSGDFPPDPANTMVVDPAHPAHWYVGTDTGVWFSKDEGTRWFRLGTFPNVVVYDLELHPGERQLVAATYGRGIWTIDL